MKKIYKKEWKKLESEQQTYATTQPCFTPGHQHPPRAQHTNFLRYKASLDPSADLALPDVKTDGARVVILEVLQHVVPTGANLITHSLSRRTVAARDGVRVARRKASAPQITSLHGLVVVRGLLVRRRLEHADIHHAGAGRRVAGCLEVLLHGEEEHERARLAGVGGWDVEVEDGADAPADLAVVLRSVRLVGRCGVDWHDEVA